MITEGTLVTASFDTATFIAENVNRERGTCSLYRTVVYCYADGTPDCEPHGYSYNDVPLREVARLHNQQLVWEFVS
jgi:uncharacterized protein YgiB involved in biofilm formation